MDFSFTDEQQLLQDSIRRYLETSYTLEHRAGILASEAGWSATTWAELAARGWSLDRITRVDLAILRLGVYEMMYGSIAPAVAINEAVELANAYSTDKAGSFVNGVLGNISRSLEK